MLKIKKIGDMTLTEVHEFCKERLETDHVCDEELVCPFFADTWSAEGEPECLLRYLPSEWDLE